MKIWKPIPILDGFYEASTDGEVRRRQASSGAKVGLIKKTRTLPKGYLVVSLSVRNKPETRLVHRLVADAFHGGCVPGLQVNHIDGDRKNNRPENLEYVTQSENNLHAVKRIGAYRGNRRKDSTVTAEIVKAIYEKHKEGMGYTRLSRLFNITWATARNVASGKTWAWATGAKA